MSRVRLPIVLAASLGLCAIPSAARAWPGVFLGAADGGPSDVPRSRSVKIAVFREGTRNVIALSADYEGPSKTFALVILVPASVTKETVRVLPPELFERLERIDAPRLGETWERDPCGREARERPPRPATLPLPSRGAGGVDVEPTFTTGPYAMTILGSKDAARLPSWLAAEGLRADPATLSLLRTHLTGREATAPPGNLLVARVAVGKEPFREGHRLPPIRFHYDASELALPMGEDAEADVVVHVFAKGAAYEAAAANSRVATDLEVAERTRGTFPSFYAGLVEATVARRPGIVLTEYVQDARACVEPCAEPPLNDAELVMLGADVLPSVSSEPDLLDPQILDAIGVDAGASVAIGPFSAGTTAGKRRRYYGLQAFVLSRLHLSAGRARGDLVLREARSTVPFVARYEVRHPWGGAADCPAPVRGSFAWRAPASGIDNGPVRLALDLPRAPRLAEPLDRFLVSDVNELAIVGRGERSSPSVGPVPVPMAVPPPPAPPARKASSGCGACAAVAAPAPAGGAGGALVAGVLWAFARRFRRARSCGS